jgi:hypothetical protein
VRRIVADRGLDPGRTKLAHVRGLGAVATAHLGAKPGRDESQAAHPRPADPDEVKAATRPRPLRVVGRRRGGPGRTGGRHYLVRDARRRIRPSERA